MKESVAIAIIAAVTVIAVSGIALASGSYGHMGGIYDSDDWMMDGHMDRGMMGYGNWSQNYSYQMPMGYCWNYTQNGNYTYGTNYTGPWHMPSFCGWNGTWQSNQSYQPYCWSNFSWNETADNDDSTQTQQTYQEPWRGCH